MTFREKIIKYRADHNMTQAELGELMGVSTRTVVSYERGEKTPYQKNYYRIAEKLGVSLKYLMDDECTDPNDGTINTNNISEWEYEATDKMREILNLSKDFFSDKLVSKRQKEWVFHDIMRFYLAGIDNEDILRIKRN